MEGLSEFIIEIGKAFSDTIKHGSLELIVDYRVRQQEQSNRIGKVVSVPMQVETKILPGAEVVIDPTVLFEQTYRGKLQKSQFLVDENKGLYRVENGMVLIYKNPSDDRWYGNKRNCFVKPLEENKNETKSGLFIPKPKNDLEGYAEVVFINKELESWGIKEGDIIFYKKDRKWKFQLGDQEFLYLQNDVVLGKSEKI